MCIADLDLGEQNQRRSTQIRIRNTAFLGIKGYKVLNQTALLVVYCIVYRYWFLLAAWRARERGGPAEGGAGRGHEGGGGHEAEVGGPHPVLQQERGRAPETARPPECQVQ
jgi:hypothetical protein